MIRINLLPVRSTKKKDKLRSNLVVLVAAVLVTIAGCGVVYASLLASIHAERESIAAKEAEIQSLKKAIGEVAQFKKLQEELRGKLEVLGKLKDGKTGPVHLLDNLELAVPEKLWLTSFKETGGAISISGLGLNEETVAQFLRDLNASPYFTGVELKVIEQVTQGGTKLHKFDLTCRGVRPEQKKS
jgi:type IV pilus assembly protein PilN